MAQEEMENSRERACDSRAGEAPSGLWRRVVTEFGAESIARRGEGHSDYSEKCFVKSAQR